MSDVKIVRLQTGEDVISKVEKDTMGNYTFDKPFVIIPQLNQAYLSIC